MPNDLTPAEQATAVELSRIYNCLGGNSVSEASVPDEARAVVAAVRPIIEAEVLDEAAIALSGLAKEGRHPLSREGHTATGLEAAARNLREQVRYIRAALRGDPIRAAERQAEGDGNG